jgi:hypothetical protein
MVLPQSFLKEEYPTEMLWLPGEKHFLEQWATFTSVPALSQALVSKHDALFTTVCNMALCSKMEWPEQHNMPISDKVSMTLI